jgi:triosephosphate isomerase
MPTYIIAGNWKMNTTIQEAKALVTAMRPRLEAIGGVQKVVCPPFVSLAAVGEALRGSSIGLGAQNMHHEEKGAFTGEVSPAMLVGLCQYVILGHSERRQLFGEADDFINKKVKAALKAGLRPILCVGERLPEREEGRAEEVVEGQLRGSLAGIDAPGGLVVAYEPVWAIGTGRAATPDVARSMMAHIRRALSSLYGAQAASGVSLLYGGSVNPGNTSDFMRQKDIDGALVGGASLQADSFVEIVKKAAEAKRV